MRSLHRLLLAGTALGICCIRREDNFDGGYDPADHWPATFYGPADEKGGAPQSAVFNSPLEVPDGWHDHPSKVGDPAAKTDIPGYDEAVAAAESGDELHTGEGPVFAQDVPGEEDLNGDGVDPNEPGQRNSGEDDPDVNIRETAERKGYVLPEFDDIEKDDIIERLNTIKPKLSFNSNWNKHRLYDLLKDNVGRLGDSSVAVSEGNKL